MKELLKYFNIGKKTEGQSMTLLISLVSLVITAMSGCTSNGSNNTVSTANQEEQSVELVKEPQTPEEEADDTPCYDILSQLYKDMVYIEREDSSFHICKYEVTQKLWKEVMGNNPSQMQGDDLPVEQVNWNDCQTFISKLNELTGKKYRLPTEVEWEYACRGGKHSKGYAYSGSNELDEVAWYDENSEGKTHPVGQKKPNELGLYDMSGNVWEWCQDMHESTGMCRGGSWIHNARNCDPSLPNETPRAFYINSLGLRLAM